MNNKTGIVKKALGNEELSAINSFALTELNPDDVYVFSLTLCDNEVDRDNERFSIDALKELSKLFVGKPGIFDHSMKAKDQTARIYSASVETSETKTTSYGEPYCELKAKAYMLRNEKNASLISEIEAGIKKEVSVSCAVESYLCSICGESKSSELCNHIREKEYDGTKCHAIISNAIDAYEWSFVAVPAQPAAGITKKFTPNENSINYKFQKMFKIDETPPDKQGAQTHKTNAETLTAMFNKKTEEK